MCRPALVRGEEGQQNFNQPTASSGCFSFPGGDGRFFFFLFSGATVLSEQRNCGAGFPNEGKDRRGVLKVLGLHNDLACPQQQQ